MPHNKQVGKSSDIEVCFLPALDNISPSVLTKVRQLIPSISKDWIALAPATAWANKTWPAEHWKKLIASLLKSIPDLRSQDHSSLDGRPGVGRAANDTYARIPSAELSGRQIHARMVAPEDGQR